MTISHRCPRQMPEIGVRADRRRVYSLLAESRPNLLLN